MLIREVIVYLHVLGMTQKKVGGCLRLTDLEDLVSVIDVGL